MESFREGETVILTLEDKGERGVIDLFIYYLNKKCVEAHSLLTVHSRVRCSGGEGGRACERQHSG